jgi:molybdopterin converting factor small subunit
MSLLRIKVIFFASARVLTGVQAIMMNIGDESSSRAMSSVVDDDDDDSSTAVSAAVNKIIVYTSEDIKEKLTHIYPDLNMKEHRLTLIHNGIYLKSTDVVQLRDGDVIGIMPPIAGG